MTGSYHERLDRIRAEFAAARASSQPCQPPDSDPLSGGFEVPFKLRRRSSRAPSKLTESFSVAVSPDDEFLSRSTPGAVVLFARDLEALGPHSVVRMTLQIESTESLPGRNTDREKLIAVALAAALQNFLSIVDNRG